MKLQNRIIPYGNKTVVFDANAYIAVGLNKIEIEKILLKEKGKNIKAYASLWILAELLSGEDINTLQNVNKHCADEFGRWRFSADPASQVYFILYGEESPYTEQRKKGIVDLFDKALNGNLSGQEKTHIKSQLENAGKSFVAGCQNHKGNVYKLNSDKIQKHAICQIIQKAKELRCDSVAISDEEINSIAKEFPAAGIVYQDILKRKLPQKKNKLNRESLLHDQRDWHLFFFAGRDDIYIVTQERKIRKLNLKNVICLEEYLQNVLQI